MAIKRRPLFDPNSFLAKAGEGRTVSKYRKDQVVFSQGEAADAVFYTSTSFAMLRAHDKGG